MLAVKDLSFRYSGNTHDTLHHLTFSVERGEVFGFLGPSGAGKSTTQKILYKLLTGYSGEVLFAGKPLSQWNRDFYQQIGVSFELPNHYIKLSAEENLEFFSSFYNKPTQDRYALLEKVGLKEEAKKPVADFSKGMKMRLNFVRSLLHNPDVLFLDEPTSGLDPINAGRIKDMIKELKTQGKTIFITTHNMFDADQLCDRVALLYQGEIKALDTPAHLKRQFGSRTVKVELAGNSQAPLVFPLENIGQNTEFLKAITAYEVVTIHSQEATLEEVFIKLTGAALV